MKFLISTFITLGVVYLLFCLLLYLLQENFIFFPQKLPQDYRFRFRESFEERYITAPDGAQLHGLLFKADGPGKEKRSNTKHASPGLEGPGLESPGLDSRRLVFFLHGNAGSLASWGDVAETYTRLGYDVFILDYRGYGKSEGKIKNQEQIFADVQAAYQQLMQEYQEQNTVIVGFSLGSGPAAMLAARHNPALLLLLAPYYSLSDMMQRSFPFVPSFLLKYPMRTHKFLEKASAPVYLVHGTRDEVIPYDSSLKLQEELNAGVQLIPIEGEYHNSLHASREYQSLLPKLLLSLEDKD